MRLAVTPSGSTAEAASAGNTDTLLEITSPQSAQPRYLQTDLNLPGNGLHSLFMLGGNTTPVGQLRKDR